MADTSKTQLKPEPFSCTRGTLTIRGHVWGKTEGRQHAVVLSHGFLANEKMCRTYAKLLADMGFLAVTYDFCGGGVVCRSDGLKQDMTVLTEVEDLKAVLGAVQGFSPLSVSLLGCSQGGLVSGLVAAEMGAQSIRSLMLFYPAVCIPDDARKGKMMFYRFDPQNVPDLLGRFPMKLGGGYARAVMDMDPFKLLGGYTGPVLLIHGPADKIVDISYARTLKDVYQNCSYLEIQKGRHMFKGKYDRQACAKLREFAEEIVRE